MPQDLATEMTHTANEKKEGNKHKKAAHNPYN